MSERNGEKPYGEGYDGDGAGEDAHGGASGLPEELRALGRSLSGSGAGAADGTETMVERVLAQILAEQVPVPEPEPPGLGERWRAARRWARLRWRSLTATLCGLLAVLALTPPVRAAVLDWFEFAGVEVRYDPSAVPSPGAEVPGCGPSVPFAEVERRAGFDPLVPRALGVPDVATVTAEPQGRFLISLCWLEEGRTIRLDEYRAHLDAGFTKTLREQPEWLRLGEGEASGGLSDGDQALWFPRPHLLGFWLVDGSGERYVRETRTAGPTLLWTHTGGGDGAGGAGAGSGPDQGDLTLRLEGVASKERAVEIARSLETPQVAADSSK
ncbi:hypothetical protein ABZ614_09990 [Streptomyces sp. NPDC013178]|uniref:hypothetical protein n=1 Tax=unclassified Streptomyces TaxID=2593676 RepID=UPI0033CEB971